MAYIPDVHPWSNSYLWKSIFGISFLSQQSGLLNLLYCELLKLRHSKMIPISILGAVAVPFMLLVEVVQTHAEHPEQKILLDLVYANSVLYMLVLANMMVSVAIASYLFSREYAENTWKTILPLPISRTKVLVGKFCTLFIWDFFLTLVSWLSILIFTGICHLTFGMAEYSLFTFLYFKKEDLK